MKIKWATSYWKKQIKLLANYDLLVSLCHMDLGSRGECIAVPLEFRHRKMYCFTNEEIQAGQ